MKSFLNEEIYNVISFHKENYLNKLKHENKSLNTIKSYNNTLSIFLMYIMQFDSIIDLKTIKPSHIYSFFDFRERNMEKQKEISVGTKRVTIAHLKAFFGYIEMESDDLLDFTKLFKSFKFKIEKQAPKGLEAETEKKLLNYIELLKTENNDYPTIRNALIVKTMLFSGVRVSEMLSIKYEDYIEVDDLIYEISVIGKGRKQRFVYLEKALTEDELSELIENRGKSALVCLSQTGKIIPRQNIDKMLKSLCRRAGILMTSAHKLRHTFANKFSNLHKGNILHLQDILGHSDIRTSMGYANPRQEDIRNGFISTIKN